MPSTWKKNVHLTNPSINSLHNSLDDYISILVAPTDKSLDKKSEKVPGEFHIFKSRYCITPATIKI